MLTDKLLLNNDLLFIEVLQRLSQGYFVTLRIKGDSMFPFIEDGRDSVVLLKCRDISVGDIVLVRIPEKGYVLHRIYRMKGEWLTLMGDGNIQTTERCQRKDVLGKAVKILRNGRCVECSSFWERFKATCWRRLLPIRHYLLFVYNCV